MLQLLLLLCSFGVIFAFLKSICDPEKNIDPQSYRVLSSSSDDEACLDPAVENVVKMLRDRSRIGVAKYGKTLWEDDSTSKRQWITHAQEELLDAANYLEKIKTLF